MTRITLRGRDWTQPEHLTAMQRERMEAPIASEFEGRWRWASWTAAMVISIMMWAALFAWWLS